MNVIFLAFETLPYPSCAPTRADIEKLKLRGTNHKTMMHWKAIAMDAWAVEPRTPDMICKAWLHHSSKQLMSRPLNASQRKMFTSLNTSRLKDTQTCVISLFLECVA